MPFIDVQIRDAKPIRSARSSFRMGRPSVFWIQPTASKPWNLASRFAGKQRKLVLGPYPIIASGEARERCEQAKRLLLDGIDPSQHRGTTGLLSTNQHEHTFRSLSAQVLDKKRREGKAGATLVKVEWLLSQSEIPNRKAALVEH